jgi:hypothetical protein
MVMKKLFLISFLLISLYSLGQPGYTDINSGYRWLRGNFRALHVPSGTSFGLQTGQWPGAGALYLDTVGADSGFYYRGVNASWHRLPKATETFYLGDGTFSSNRTVTGGGFSLTFSGLSTFTLGSTGAQSFNANGGVGVRSDIYLRPDSILIEPHDGKITIDSLRSGHPTDTTTYKPMVWSPTNKSWRYLTGWPGTGGSSGITVGTTTITSGTDTRVPFNDAGVYNEDAGFTYDKTANQLDVPNLNIPFGGKMNVARIDMAGSVSLSIRNGGGAELANWDHTSGLFYQQYPAKFDNYLDVKEISDPSTGAAGYIRAFSKNNGLYVKDEAGVVTKTNEQQTRTLTIEAPTGTENISFFYTDKAITITKAAYAVRGSSPSVTIDVHHHTDRSSGSPNELFGTNVAVTSTTGTTNTTFNDATIPAGSFVWVISSAASGTNNELTITLTFNED